MVKIVVVLTILLLMQVGETPSNAQLDRLRKSKSLEAAAAADTPMVAVPEGSFTMGVDGTQALEDERPAHRPWLATFSIDLHEIATAQYAEFLKATGRPAPWQWETVELARHGDRPVIGVDWADADAYCRWKGNRLPTEAEWEKAARGTDGRFYPWGNQAPTQDLANFALGARFSYSQVLMPVYSYERGKSPFGVLQMAGNVYEWVQDWYGANYYEVSPDHNPAGPVRSRANSRCYAAVPGLIFRSISSRTDDSSFLPTRGTATPASVAPSNRTLK